MESHVGWPWNWTLQADWPLTSAYLVFCLWSLRYFSACSSSFLMNGSRLLFLWYWQFGRSERRQFWPYWGIKAKFISSSQGYPSLRSSESLYRSSYRNMCSRSSASCPLFATSLWNADAQTDSHPMDWFRQRSASDATFYLDQSILSPYWAKSWSCRTFASSTARYPCVSRPFFSEWWSTSPLSDVSQPPFPSWNPRRRFRTLVCGYWRASCTSWHAQMSDAACWKSWASQSSSAECPLCRALSRPCPFFVSSWQETTCPTVITAFASFVCLYLFA